MDTTYEVPVLPVPKPAVSKAKVAKKRELTEAEYSRIFDTPNAKLQMQTPKDDRQRDPDFAPNGMPAQPDADGDGKRKSQPTKVC